VLEGEVDTNSSNRCCWDGRWGTVLGVPDSGGGQIGLRPREESEGRQGRCTTTGISIKRKGVLEAATATLVGSGKDG